MKFNLQYFAESNVSAAPSSASVAPSSASQSVSQSTAPSSSAKTYTQAEVDRIAKEAVADKISGLKSASSDQVAKAVAHQKKLDNMNATELKQELAKEHKAKLDKIVAENKQFKHQAEVNKALKATNELLSKAHIPNSDRIVQFVMDTDPKVRAKKVQELTEWLNDYKENLKSDLLKGKHEPQTGDESAVPTSDKDGKKLNPFEYAELLQKKQGN